MAWQNSASFSTRRDTMRLFTLTCMRESATLGSVPSSARSSVGSRLPMCAGQKKPTLCSGELFTPRIGIEPTWWEAASSVPSPPTVTTRLASLASNTTPGLRSTVIFAPSARNVCCTRLRVS
jgi:hypothetical protein